MFPLVVISASLAAVQEKREMVFGYAAQIDRQLAIGVTLYSFELQFSPQLRYADRVFSDDTANT